jgi:hypothetical protein
MKFGKVSLVLVVVIALVGVYFFAPNLLSGVASDEVRISVKYINIPEFAPDDLTVLLWLDGNSIDDVFVVDVGSPHSLTFRAMYADGSIYGEATRMFTAPAESGNYDMIIDGTTRMMELVAA